MGNMCKHIKKCWGEDVLDQVMQMWSFSAAHDAVKSYQSNRTITTTFERKDKAKRTYSHQLHTKTQSR